MTRLAKPLSEIDQSYDVVIIGSGYGGGVSASRLSRAGLKVAVLERGKEFVTGEFPHRFPELKNEMQVTGQSIKTGADSALFDVRVGEDMHVVVGCGVGGGSLVNAGVTLRPDDRVFADPVWPGHLRQDGLINEGYKRAEKWLKPNAHERASEMTKYKTLATAADQLGEHMAPPRVVISFKDAVSSAGIAQPACTLCGDCCGGCNVGAKNTVALTYLPDAIAHGAEVYSLAKVRTIEKGQDGSWLVNIAAINEKGTTTPETIAVAAKTVILSAGTLGSSEVLLRSKEAGLPVSDRLGQRFSANGDIIAFGYGATEDVNSVGLGHPKKIEDMEIGASVSGQVEVRDKDNLDHEMNIQEGALPSAIAPILPVLFVPNGRILGALKSLINGVYKGPFAKMQTFFAVSHDSASGVFSLQKDRLKLSWPNAKDEPVYKRLDEKLKELVTTCGGSYVKNPLSGTMMGHQPATAHPLGGCAMADSIATGVVNHKGQVFDSSNAQNNPESTAVHAGLYVIDGSVIPRSLGVNPLFTITALAERAMIHFAQDHNLTFCDDIHQGEAITDVHAPGAVAQTELGEAKNLKDATPA